jgi:hypothetical protein
MTKLRAVAHLGIGGGGWTESEGKSGGIPHLAKNERDVGHPAFVAGATKEKYLRG